jgi:hypothetical protein
MEMSSLLLCCVLCAENPGGDSPSAAAVSGIETAGVASQSRTAPGNKPARTDRYKEYPFSGAAAAQPRASELEETEAEARQINAAGGPDMLGAPGAQPAARRPESSKHSAGETNQGPAKRPADSAGLSPLAPVKSPPLKAGEADELVRALAASDGLALPGVATPLVELMSRLADRRQQIEVTQTYWQLAASVAAYRIAADRFHRLRQLVPPADATGQAAVDPLVDARISSAEARLREAEADVLANQYALAEASRWPASDKLPLPADAPLASGYNTRFDAVYRNVAPPARAVLLDRSLPLRHRSIEMRAAAATAAAHAAEGDFDAFAEGRADVTIALESIDELARQQRAFIEAVRDYNRDIAEYALSIAPPGLANEKLVGMLIAPAGSEPGHGANEPTMAEQPDGVRRAGFDQPIPARIRSSGPDDPPQEASKAAPRELEPHDSLELRGLTGPQRADEPQGANEPRQAEETEGPASEPTPAGEPDAPNVPRGASGEPVKAINPSEKQAGRPRGRGPMNPFSTRKPPLDLLQTVGGDAPTGLYPALVDLKPPHRTQELGTALHWARQLPADSGAPASLAECLSWITSDHRTMIEAYWQTCHRAARFHAVAQQAEQFQALDPAALHWRSHADGAEAMLRLKAAQRAAEADLVDAEIDLRIGQFTLGRLGGRPLLGAWPLPSTAPHAGRYLMKLDRQPEEIQQSSQVRRLATMTTALYEALEQESAAVVKADLVRAAAVARYEQGATIINEPLDAIRAQLLETLAFLKVQAEYNLHYADYVLAVLPQGADRQVLAKALVLQRQGG